MSTNNEKSENDLERFVESLEMPFERLFVENGPFGETIGYVLEDGREFDLAIESQEFEKMLISYLKRKGVTVR